MGLTISYTLGTKEEDAGGIRGMIAELQRRATRLPLNEVGEVIELAGDAADFRHSGSDDPNWWLLIQAGQYLLGRREHEPAPPERLIAFTTVPGDGCEPANFGLCRCPQGMPGWRWRSFCKTAYANHPDFGGVMNFLKCHIGVIKVLDDARTLGMSTEVSDPTGYFESRDTADLLRAAGGGSRRIASFLARQHGKSDEALLAAIAAYAFSEELAAAA